MTDADIEQAIAALLERRGPGKTVCPSEVARALAGDRAFRPLMDDVRRVAGALADRGVVQATQRGVPVDPRTARGPIRLRRAR